LINSITIFYSTRNKPCSYKITCLLECIYTEGFSLHEKNRDEWKWSSYQAMTSEMSARPWLETDWILGSFFKRRKIAIVKYIDFVREGIGLPSLWENLQNQIFPGTEKFVNKKQSLINNQPNN